MATNVKENYLKAIFYLDKEDPNISLSDLSKEMGVSIPTVNSMVKRLQEEKWVVYQKYKPLKLTAKGRKTAALIIRKHRLTEMFLEKFMGFGWEEVHDIAEEIEHVRIEKFFDRMDELLGFPAMDPHGSPIPDKDGNIKPRDFKVLSDIEAGKVVRISALKESSQEFLHYLNRQQIKLGTVMEVIRIEEFDKSVQVQLKEQPNPMVLSADVSSRLLVDIL
ncbi:MAG: iron (metal) dependent repressor, dtxr family protein [Fluviicola sp. XM-24bin1]|nr:MAG: iron (metal) dependent repressor, dtxr family protein [Fluviicola sp. XM-24bin1]